MLEIETCCFNCCFYNGECGIYGILVDVLDPYNPIVCSEFELSYSAYEKYRKEIKNV
jgi:hypothetical protein